jgi:tripartite-type tricarboxylate transporter receptor subunit TctC
MPRPLRTGAAIVAALALAGCGSVGGGDAENYPRRDIKVIVPFAPGGGSDLIARALAPCMRQSLSPDIDVVVQNVTGAGGRIGTFDVYDARNDGYTIGMLEPYTLTIAELTGQAGDRSAGRLNWLGQAASVPFTLVVNGSSGYRKPTDLRGKEVKVAVTQVSLAPTIKYFEALGATPRLVYYEGGSETMLAAVRGDVEAAVQVAPTALRAIDADRDALRVIAVLDDERFPQLPDTPTSAEAGVPLSDELATIAQYAYTYAAPPDTPAEITTKISDAISAAVEDAGCAEKMRNAELEPAHQSGEEVARSVQTFRDTLATVTDDLRRASGG